MLTENNPDAIISVVFATSNNIPADGTSTASVTAQVTDSAGAGLFGQSVVFTATAGALIGSPVITDTSGLATTTLTSTTAGISSVTASVNSSTGHVDITFTEAALSPVISSLISDKDSIVNDGTDKATFVATVSDRGTGETLTGVTVHWSSSPGTVLPAISLSNDSGLAVAALSDSGDTGEATVTASLDNGEIATCDINLESSDVSWVISKLTSSKDTLVNDGVDTVKFTVTVKDGSGSTVSGATVSWVTTLGTLNHKQQVTDESGHAFVKLSDTGDTGEATVTASLNNGDEKTCPVLVQASVTAQTVRGGRRCGGYSRDSLSWLVTLDRETGRPTEALWQYEGDSTGVTAVWFDDPAPVKILRVLSLAGETLATLCPLNIVGYSKAVAASGHSFAALNTGGGAVGWGEIDVPSSIATRTDLVTLESAGSAFAALTTAGGVVTWGNSTNGGSVPSSIGSRTDLVALAGTAGAFAVLTKAGGVVAWGGNGYGETVPPMIANRTDLMYLTGIAYAFAALTAGGGVVGWGNSDYGGIVPSAIASRTDLVALSGSGYAFAALTASGGVVAWGGAFSVAVFRRLLRAELI
ncbi:Ig-like domain-containing protein [Kluyvera intermedia]|uniref:Ig-like domain-containing protein n=1 Tax=Kluyvera intermedia TaxID=61648 RepID=UPI0035244F42